MRNPLFRSLPHAIALLCAMTAGMEVAPAAAHAVLAYFSAQKGPVPAGKDAIVILRFNDNIEVLLSRVFLLDAQGQLRPVKIDPGAKRNEIVVHLPPLPPGTYGLRYRMHAADGHSSDEIARFRVAEEK